MFFRALNGNSSGDCIMHTNYWRPSSIRSVYLLNGKQFFQSLSTYAHSTAGIHKPGALELEDFWISSRRGHTYVQLPFVFSTKRHRCSEVYHISVGTCFSLEMTLSLLRLK